MGNDNIVLPPIPKNDTILEDIHGRDHMGLEWGDRFKSWYRNQKLSRTETILIADNSFRIKVCEYQYRFIIPARMEFYKGIGNNGKVEYGIISYSESERLFGIFRFPQDASTGFFMAPLSIEKMKGSIKVLSAEDLQSIIGQKKVLTFEAFRIPYFGFEYFNIPDSEFKEMEKTVPKDVMSSIRSSYETGMLAKVNKVKDKISELPNYLLILQNVLDHTWKNENEISQMTNGIIHFGI